MIVYTFRGFYGGIKFYSKPSLEYSIKKGKELYRFTGPFSLVLKESISIFTLERTQGILRAISDICKY